MKIYILPVHDKLQPGAQSFKYPVHNQDYGVEQDFLFYLMNHKELLTENPSEADWHFLPVYWTRWQLNHNYGKSGLEELQNFINSTIKNDLKTFTVCQYDDGPIAKLGNTKIFLSSRKTDLGLDIPLLSTPHKKPFFKPKKKYLASFIGRVSTHPIRSEMVATLQNIDDIFIYDGDNGSPFFVKKGLESYISLCPRGYGGSSFRFYEVMQLGVVPFLIGDIDTRPFKKFINWESFSFYSKEANSIVEKLSSLKKSELLSMGKKAESVWKENLCYQNWCQFLILELEAI